jgi:hypothetical protein
MCAQKQFLDAPEPTNPHNRTKMGPKNRIEAIREVERDILDALKRLSKYTTDTSMKKLHAMPLEDFTKKHAALPQFKRLYRCTLRATRDGQQLAPRRTKHDFYYRLFDEFVYLLDMQNDQLPEIEETMDSLRELHDFRKQTLTRPTIGFKPVKNRPPTPLPRPNLRQILQNADQTLSQSSSFQDLSPRRAATSPSGYSSSSSSSSESTITTTSTTTTTVRHVWSDSSDSEDSETYRRQSKRDN